MTQIFADYFHLCFYLCLYPCVICGSFLVPYSLLDRTMPRRCGEPVPTPPTLKPGLCRSVHSTIHPLANFHALRDGPLHETVDMILHGQNKRFEGARIYG